ncbi:MAG: hypothetical protein JRJ42_03355 [Deltaproteobacteria bacterium]|mgnify:CR=1 FL=1|nr:hypothetical protein [Deltaproteobacteria bacterium]MBW2019260.1 hypothetical protein [Deltaproteobacteria bacterium]MBW2074066.1 hypothetical protein [Deltaproteobacteria bacterium]RLB82507.1 MAG: hypothetical protein DRH17_05690 [Deltaproteobacteria bacterium]
MFGEKVTRGAKQSDEIAYLKIILDSLVQGQSLFETGDVDPNKQFLQELKCSVDSMLRIDSRIQEDVRIKVLNAFDVLIDNYAKYIEV